MSNKQIRVIHNGVTYSGGGGGGSSNVSITPSLPRGTKIANYSIDGVSNELLAPVVNILQEDYDALPDTKNSDGIAYFVTTTKELDSNYTYHKYGTNDEIVVRVYHEGKTDEEIVWFFKGFTKTASNWSIPSELQAYTPDVSTLGSTTSKTYDTSDSDTHTGWIGWSKSVGRDVIRSWSTDWNTTLAGTFYAVVKVDGGDEQDNLYENPYVWVGSTSRKIMLNGETFVSSGGGGSSVIPNPSAPATDTLNTVEIDNVIYSLPTGGGGGSGGSGYQEVILWENVNGLTFGGNNRQTITLNDNISNYDMLCCAFADARYSWTKSGLAFHLVSEIDTTGVVGFWENNPLPTDIRATPFSVYRSDTSIELQGITSNFSMIAYKVIGIKFGGGGSSGISYGYANPPSEGNDGNVYILLNSNDKKKGEYLYKSDQWILIDGTAYVPPISIYNNGVESITLNTGGSAPTKDSDRITFVSGGGSFTSYVVTAETIDVTNYETIYISYSWKDVDYTRSIDVSSYTGNKYISIGYLTDRTHNELSIGLTDTAVFEQTIVIETSSTATSGVNLYTMTIS